MRISTLNCPVGGKNLKSQRSERELSGVQAVLAAAIANLEVSNQNLSASDSHLAQTEMSPEMVTFTEQQIRLRAL